MIRLTRALSLCAAVPLVVSPAPCQQIAPGQASDVEAARDVLVFGRSGDSITLDPGAASDAESAKVIDNIFETLLDFSEDPKTPARTNPGLATEWRHSADRMTWTFQLRKGIRFHDGEPLDASAVKFSLERLIDPAHPYAPERVPYRSTYGRIRSVEVLGPHRFRIRLNEPSVILLHNLAMFAASIVSPTAVVKAGKDFGRRPVGSGPFKFESWTRGRIELTYNDDWWVEKTGTLKGLVFLAVEEWSKRREMLKSGRLHVADNLDAGDTAWLASTPGIAVKQVPGMNVCYLAINNEQRPLDQPDLRRAIAQAVDRERILRFGYAGAGVVARDLLPGRVEGGNKPILPQTDIGAARSAVKKGNWSQTPLRLWYMKNQRPYVPNPERVAQIIRDCLREAGLTVDIESFEWPVYREKLKAGAHQLALMGWTTDNGDADNFYTPLLSEASIGATNYTRLRNAKFETLLQASREEEDRRTRLSLFGNIQELLLEQCPIVPLVHSNVAFAMLTDIEGLEPHPIKLRLYNVRRGGK